MPEHVFVPQSPHLTPAIFPPKPSEATKSFPPAPLLPPASATARVSHIRNCAAVPVWGFHPVTSPTARMAEVPGYHSAVLHAPDRGIIPGPHHQRFRPHSFCVSPPSPNRRLCPVPLAAPSPSPPPPPRRVHPRPRSHQLPSPSPAPSSETTPHRTTRSPPPPLQSRDLWPRLICPCRPSGSHRAVPVSCSLQRCPLITSFDCFTALFSHRTCVISRWRREQLSGSPRPSSPQSLSPLRWWVDTAEWALGCWLLVVGKYSRPQTGFFIEVRIFARGCEDKEKPSLKWPRILYTMHLRCFFTWHPVISHLWAQLG